MNVDFYRTTSNDKKVVKELTNKNTKHCQLKENTNLINPVLLVSFNPISYNYAIIEDFENRHYFVTDYENIGNGLWLVRLEIDILATYWSKIQGLSVVTRRNENEYNTYLNDAEFLCYNYTFIQQKQFPSGFDTTPRLYITVSGGDV